MTSADTGSSILMRVIIQPRALRRVALVVGSATVLVAAYAGPAAADIPLGLERPGPGARCCAT